MEIQGIAVLDTFVYAKDFPQYRQRGESPDHTRIASTRRKDMKDPNKVPIIIPPPSKKETLDFKISVDEKTGNTIYRGIDGKTGDVVWQAPAKEVVNLSQWIKETVGEVLDRVV